MSKIPVSLKNINILPHILFFIMILFTSIYLLHEYIKKGERERTQYQNESQIDTLISVYYGGIEQWMLIRGEDRSAPVLLILHGGPGAPLFPSARIYGKKTGMERLFITVYWEQPGTGKSYHFNMADTLLSVNRLVEYAHDMTIYLHKHFRVNEIYLMGRSFGSLVGMLLIEKYPHNFAAFISISQFINTFKNDSISYEIAKKWAYDNKNEEAIEDLNSVGPPPYNAQELLLQRKWVTFIHDSQSNTEHTDYLDLLLKTPEYSLFDIISMGLDPLYSIRSLWTSEIYNIDLHTLIPAVQVPVYFFVGKHDILSSPELIRSYFNKLEAPAGKKLYIFDSSGHEPDVSNPDMFLQIVERDIL